MYKVVLYLCRMSFRFSECDLISDIDSLRPHTNFAASQAAYKMELFPVAAHINLAVPKSCCRILTL
jgi:hypothetical protein